MEIKPEDCKITVLTEAKIRVCEICGKEYTWRDSRGERFCSKLCWAKHMSKARIGEGNPRFNHGWRQYRRMMEDVTACQNCGRHYGLEIHHKDGNHKNNTLTNLIKVCRRCHMLMDGRLENLNYRNSGTGLCAGDNSGC